MTIRTKLTLWYAAVLFASLFLLGGLLYREWVLEPKIHPKTTSIEDNEEGLQDLMESLLWSALPAALLGLGGGWLLTRKVLSPVASLTQAAREINERNLHNRIPQSANGDELDQLTSVFNDMTQRLDDSFQRIREFTLRASHELKTPLTIMRAGVETTLQQKGLSNQLHECLTDELDEIDRLTQIVDGLTLLTKADAGLVTHYRESVALDQLVLEAFADGEILAKPYDLTLTLVTCEPTIVSGDKNRLRQLLLNLIDNAVKYNQEQGSIRLELRHERTMAVFAITNSGPGLSIVGLERAFEPFFRGDKSHSRSVEGCGLGLAIARWIVTMHEGTIVMNSDLEGETTVLFRLPLLTE